jgi:hypothetical protein
MSQSLPRCLGPCHHYGMVCPLVAYGGDGLQTWRVATNVLSKQSSSSLVAPHHKKSLLQNITQVLKKSGSCEHGNEPLGSVRDGEFDKLRDSQLLKKDSTPLSIKMDKVIMAH